MTHSTPRVSTWLIRIRGPYLGELPSPRRRGGDCPGAVAGSRRFIALGVDALQFGLLPLVLGGAVSPVNDAIDVTLAVIMVSMLGWHWAFLPTFLVELIPVVDLAPTWTIAVFLATRGR